MKESSLTMSSESLPRAARMKVWPCGDKRGSVKSAMAVERDVMAAREVKAIAEKDSRVGGGER